MNIESYKDLEREIQKYQDEIEHLNDKQRQLDESNLSAEERIREQEDITRNVNSTNETLNNLLDIQKAYNTFVEDVKAIQKIDLENVSNKEEAQEEINARQNEIIEARKILPESLQREIRENLNAQNESLNNNTSINTSGDLSNNSTGVESFTQAQNNVDYVNEYEKLTNKFNQLLGDKDLDEIGINDFDEVERRYNEVSAERDKLFDAVNALKGQISEEKFNDLLGIDSGLKEKIDRDIREFKVVKETKVTLKEEKEKEIEAIKNTIEDIKVQQTDAENKINGLLRSNPNDPGIEKYREIVRGLQESISKNEKKLDELNSELDTILNGGKIEMTSSVDEVIEQAKKEVEASTRKIQDQTQQQVQPQTQQQIQPQTQTQTRTRTQTRTPAPASAPTRPMPPVQPKAQNQGPTTLDSLVKSGKLPNNLSDLELFEICSKLGINITDVNTVLSKEQLERLVNDHEIQVALLSQKIVKRNQEKISKYDNLIAKYESILKDKMEGKEFSDEYVAKVQTLLEKCKNERQVYVDRNKNITARDHSEFLGRVSELREDGLDGRATKINDKLRSQYKKQDEILNDKSRSKFKKWINKKRLEFLESRISRLRDKKGVIANKQTQIVNNNTTKYIDRMSKKIKRHLTRQGRVDKSVDRINELSRRIIKNNQERQNVAFDRQTETRLLDRIGLAFEDRILQAQASGLEGQRNVEDFVGRLR